MENGALSWLAVNGDRASMVVHDAVDNREPESGALPLWLGGEERFKDVFHCSRGHAASVVGDRQPDVGTFLSSAQVRARSALTTTVSSRTSSTLPSCIASAALVARFIRIWGICVVSADTAGAPAVNGGGIFVFSRPAGPHRPPNASLNPGGVVSSRVNFLFPLTGKKRGARC